MDVLCALMNLARTMVEEGETDYKKFQSRIKDEFDVDLDDDSAKAVWIGGGERYVNDPGEAAAALKKAEESLRKAVVSSTETTGKEFLAGLYRAGLLASARPMQASLIGNVASYTLNSAARLPSSMIDYMVSKRTGTRTVNMAGTAEGFRSLASKEALANAVEVLLSGTSDLNKMDTKKRVNYRMFGSEPEGVKKAAAKVTDPVTQALSFYINKVFDVIGAADQPGKLAYLKQSLEMNATAKAMNEGYKGSELRDRVDELLGPKLDLEVLMATADKIAEDNPDLAGAIGEIVLESRSDIDIGLMQNSTAATRAASALSESAGVVSTLFLPFVKVPTNATAQALEWSPLGMIYGAKKLADVLAKPNAADQKKVSLLLGRSLTGVPLIAFGYWLAQKGLFSEALPVNQGERDTFEAAGRVGSGIALGGRWYSIRDIPQLSALSAGAMLYRLEQLDKIDEKTRQPLNRVMAASAENSVRTALDLPTAKGVSDFVQTAQQVSRDFREGDTESKLKEAKSIASLGGSVIPSGVSDIISRGDDKVRLTKDIGDQLQADGTGRTALPTAPDSLGRDRKRASGLLGQVRGLSGDLSEQKADKVAQELYRLGIANQKPKKVNDPARPDQDKTLFDYAERLKLVGSAVRAELESVISSEWYAAATDKDRKEELQKIMRQTKSAASKEVRMLRETRS